MSCVAMLRERPSAVMLRELLPKVPLLSSDAVEEEGEKTSRRRRPWREMRLRIASRSCWSDSCFVAL